MRLDDWNQAFLGILCSAGTVQIRLELALDTLCEHVNACSALVFVTRQNHPLHPVASSAEAGGRRRAAGPLLQRLRPSIEWFLSRHGPDFTVQTPSTVTVFSPRSVRSANAATTFGLIVEAVPLELADQALSMAEQISGWYAGSVEHLEVHRAEQRRFRIYEKAFRDSPHCAVLVDADGIILDANTAVTALLTRNHDVEALCGTDIGVWLSREPTIVRASGQHVRLLALPTLDEKQLIWIVSEPDGKAV